jgi:hypothetical protein
MGKAVQELRGEFSWLEPPVDRGQLTVMDVVRAETGEEHIERVQDWALSAWQAWSAYHDRIAEYAHLLFNR